MPTFFTAPFADAPQVEPLALFLSLVIALLLGTVVAAIYRRTRRSSEIAASFPTTLILLTILIAMVTQVIGDNVARAFSLVGALSIVRFRTVVRDTQDTAFVIFAVVTGMAVGTHNLWMAGLGIVVVGCAAAWSWMRAHKLADTRPAFVLTVRLALGLDPARTLGEILDAHLGDRELVSMGTAKQGIAMEYAYETRLRPGGSPQSLVDALNQTEGVQSVLFRQRGVELG